MKKVILIGYMGSGKSIVSKMLSEKLGIPFIELDAEIEKETGMSISNLFSSKGELFFRKKEHEIFTRLIQKNTNLIISTGGGTPCYYDNHLLLNSKDCISIYLKASIDSLIARLIHEKGKRPVITSISDDELKEFISKQLFERSFYYHQATHTINVDEKNLDEIVDEITFVLA